MGKKDFGETHYAPLCKELYGGEPASLKICKSDSWQPGHSYAIVILYTRYGEPSDGNLFLGNNRCFLNVVFKDTSNLNADRLRSPEQDTVHDSIFRDIIGEHPAKNKISCGGASIKDDVLRFSSHVLNKSAQTSSAYRYRWNWDGSPHLSYKERVLVKLAVDRWQSGGANQIVHVPRSLHEVLMGRRTGQNLDVQGVPVR
mmetsp:Transcript_57289/g.70016  ORF Transcript_57289/g.70016 Transcript_57289/m.70016 type:complete len:200 (-) Transcript_57289:216-815(-)